MERTLQFENKFINLNRIISNMIKLPEGFDCGEISAFKT